MEMNFIFLNQETMILQYNLQYHFKETVSLHLVYSFEYRFFFPLVRC